MMSESDVNETSGGASQSGTNALSASSSSSSPKPSSHSLPSSLSSEQDTIEEIPSSVQQVPIDAKSKCPFCPKGFTRATSVRRHIKEKHKNADVENITISSVSHCCPHCGKMFSNLSKHYQHCKEKKSSNLTPPAVDPEGYNGDKFVTAYNKWVGEQHLATDYSAKLVAKLKRVIACWEKKFTSFKADALLNPFESQVMLPSLSHYLHPDITLGDKKMAITAYVSVCDFIVDYLSTQESAISTIGLAQRSTYIANIFALRQLESQKIKRVGKKQRRMTMIRKEEKAQDPEELNFNSERLKLVVTTILQDEKLNSLRKSLARMSPGMMIRKHKETKIRYFLMSQLWAAGAGHRPSAITNMMVSELQNATTTSDPNVMLVKVKKHKTFHIHGRAKIPFVLEGLFEACLAYKEAWRGSAQQDGFLFATPSGKPGRYTACISWLRRSVVGLKNQFSVKELKSLSGGTMRKGWSNWAKHSTDMFVKEIATKIMCHSEQVADTSYRELTKDDAAGIFASNIVGGMDGAVDDIGEDTGNVSNALQEGAQEEDNVIPSPSTSHQEGTTVETVSADIHGFSNSERDLIWSVFDRDGILPKSITYVEVGIALQKSPEFSQLYGKIVNVFGGIEANKMLTRCILEKK